VFNIGADKPYTVKYLAEVVAQAFGVMPDIRYLPARNEVAHAYADHTKARNVLGQKATVGLAEGIQRMATWARGVGARKSQEFRNIEVRQKLPAGWQVSQ